MSSYHQLLVNANINDRNRSALPTVASGALREVDLRSLRGDAANVREVGTLRQQFALRDELARLLIALASRLQPNNVSG